MTIPNIDTTTFLFLQNLMALLFQIFPKIFWAILTLLLTRWLVKLGKYFAHRLLVHVEPTLQRFLVQAVGIFLWIAGSIGALSAMGFDTTSLVTVIGAAGLAVGLALQNSLSHLAAGLLLISFRPFEVGDSIEAGSINGTVESIGLFSTAVITGDNTRITLPNGNIFGGTLKNFTVLGTRRIEMKINIGDRKIQPTMQQLLTIVQAHPLVLIDPSPTCVVTHLRRDETIVSLRPWCRATDYDRTKSDILQTTQEFLDRADLNNTNLDSGNLS